MLVKSEYLVFRVDPDLPARDVLFLVDGRPEFDLPMPLSLSAGKPAYVDVRRFLGRDLQFRILPEFPAKAVPAHSMPLVELYAAPDRQLIHFTPPFGHMNDPNGLCFYEGQYHAFYQHYPASPRVSRNSLWYRQHWGHAVSRDLLSWEIRPDALFPGRDGCAWSGSAFVDENNVSGLGENGRAPLLLFYTACGEPTLVSGGKFHQRLAFSVDGGMNFRLYPKPVVENIALDPDRDPRVYWNRDPKVVWCEELGKYVMALFLGDENYMLLTSNNLLTWNRLQVLQIPEDAECPDLYPLTAESGERFWIFSGANHRYLVGKMETGGFRPVQEAHSLRAGSDCYASQTFHGTRETLALEWMRISYRAGSDYAGGFTLPVTRKLKRLAGSYYVCEEPVSLAPIGEQTLEYPLAAGEYALPPVAAALTLECEWKKGLAFTLDAYGIPLRVDTENNRVSLGDFSAPLSIEKKAVRLTVIYDVRSVEVFADEGEFGFALCENCSADGLYVSPEQGLRGRITVQKLKKVEFTEGRTL